MFDISETTANAIYNIGNALVVVAALTGLLGAIGTIWGGAVAAKFTDLRIAGNAKDTAVAKESAAKANEGLANATLEIEDRKKENLELSLKLEGEKKERLALEKALRPRMIEQGQSAVVLRQYSNVNVIIAPLRDADCENVADQLAWLVNAAGWNISAREELDRELPGPGIVLQISDDGMGRETMELIRQLRTRSHVGATTFPTNSLKPVPARTIKINVGVNRSEYFINKQINEELSALPPDRRLEMQELFDVVQAWDDSRFADLPPEPPDAETTPMSSGNRLGK